MNLGDVIEQRAIERGMILGIARGIRKRRDNIKVQSIKAVMKNGKVPVGIAMDMLDIPIADRPRYVEIIEKDIH